MKQIILLFASLTLASASPLSPTKPPSKAVPLDSTSFLSNQSSAALSHEKIPEWLLYASQWLTCTTRPLKCSGACADDIRCTHPDVFAKHADWFQPKATNLESFPTIAATQIASPAATTLQTVASIAQPQAAGKSTPKENSHPSWKTPGKALWSKPTPGEGEFGAWTGQQLYGPGGGPPLAKRHALVPASSAPASPAATSAASKASPAIIKSKSSCALKKCTNNSACGTNAKCTLGYCACRPDYKSITSSKSALSGRRDFLPELSAVYVDTGVKCGMKCSKAGCRDVATAGVVGCFDISGTVGQPPKAKGKENKEAADPIAVMANDTSVVLPKQKGSGSIHHPGVGPGEPLLN